MIKLSMETGTAFRLVKYFLQGHGYRPAGDKRKQTTYIYSVLDCLNDWDDGYTLDQWLRDTLQNYPEDLVEI